MLRNEDSEHSLASLRVPGTVFKVGRSEGCDLRLEHQMFPLLVSRTHAELLIEDGRCILRNLYPLNGTYISGRKLEGGEAVSVSVGDVITFGGTKVVHSTDGQTQQCSNPHTFVVDGLEELLSASPPLSRAGSTQRLTDSLSDALSQPAPAEDHKQPAAASADREAADIPPPPLPEDPGAAQAPAMHLESTSPQEQEQQPGPAAQQSPLHVSVTAGVPALLPSTTEGRPWTDAARLELPQSSTGRVHRPAALSDPSIIDLTEPDDEEHMRPPVPAVPGPSGVQVQRQAERRRLRRHQQPPSEGPVTLLDDEDVEILHDSQAAAEESALQILPHSTSNAPASGTALAKQGDWVKELEDEMSCAVCQETIVAAHSLVPCGHCFCGICLFQWLNRKQICPTCRQPTEAPPVRSTLVDNIAAKSEGGMKPDEVRDREQRKQAWQALSDTAVAAWKAMFSRSKRQRAERDPYPASMYDAFMANIHDGHMPEAFAFLEDLHGAGVPTRSASRLRRARQAQHSRNFANAAYQRGYPAAQQPREHAMVPPPPPPYPPPYPAPARAVRGAPSRDPSVLQPGDVLDAGPVHRPAAGHQVPRDGSGLRVEYPPPSAQPNHCLACRRGWQAGAPRLISGTHNPIAWHLDCYQLWPMLAARTPSIPGMHRLSAAHQADIRRRLVQQQSGAVRV